MTLEIRIGSRAALRTAMCLSAVTGRDFRALPTARGKAPVDAEGAAEARALAEVLSGRLTFEQDGGRGEAAGLAFVPSEPAPAAPMRVALPGAVPLLPLVLSSATALAVRGDAREIAFEGSTHAPDGASFELGASCFVPLVKEVGLAIGLVLDAAGFAPRGRGAVRATIGPRPRSAPLPALSLDSKEPLRSIGIFSGAPASIPVHVQQRQAARARSGVAVAGIEASVQLVKLKSRKAGSVVAITGLFGDRPITVSAVSRRGASVESIGAEAAAEFRQLVSGPFVLPPVLLEPLIVASAFASGRSALSTWRLPSEIEALAGIVRDFTGREVIVEGKPGKPGRVAVELADTP